MESASFPDGLAFKGGAGDDLVALMDGAFGGNAKLDLSGADTVVP